MRESEIRKKGGRGESERRKREWERGESEQRERKRERALTHSHTFSHFWNVAKCLFFHHCNWKRLLQYLMKCLCCGTWTHPQLRWTVASQVGHYCSRLQRAQASLCPQWCQSSGICCKTAGDSGGCAAAHLLGGRSRGWKTSCRVEIKKPTAQHCTRGKATPTEPCYSGARSQTPATSDTQRLQLCADTAGLGAFSRAALSAKDAGLHLHLSLSSCPPSSTRPSLNDPMHQYHQPSTGSRCPTLAHSSLGLGAAL